MELTDNLLVLAENWIAGRRETDQGLIEVWFMAIGETVKRVFPDKTPNLVADTFFHPGSFL